MRTPRSISDCRRVRGPAASRARSHEALGLLDSANPVQRHLGVWSSRPATRRRGFASRTRFLPRALSRSTRPSPARTRHRTGSPFTSMAVCAVDQRRRPFDWWTPPARAPELPERPGRRDGQHPGLPMTAARRIISIRTTRARGSCGTMTTPTASRGRTPMQVSQRAISCSTPAMEAALAAKVPSLASTIPLVFQTRCSSIRRPSP